MADSSLADKKIAVPVESQYVATQIKSYQERFANYGAEVHLMPRLWGQPKQTLVSEVGEAGRTPETLDVNTGQRFDRPKDDRSARRRPTAAPVGVGSRTILRNRFWLNKARMRGKRDGDRAP